MCDRFAIDEFFISRTSWKDRWNERKLKSKYYATNNRAWKFWKGANGAARPATSKWLKSTSCA